MALPTLVKTWIGSYNNQVVAQGTTIDTNRALLVAIKNAMLGMAAAAWTCVYSCDSATAGTAGDGVDRWSSGASLVWAAAGSAHSWIVLKQSAVGSNFQVCISCENAGGTTLTIAVSKSAGFSGGSATSRPTATDEQVVISAATFGGVGTNVSARWTVQQSNDGQCTRVLLANNGVASGMWSFEVPQNPVSGWITPYLAGVVTTLTVGNLCATTSTPLSFRHSTTNGTMFMQTEGNTSGIGPADGNYGNAANQIDSSWPMWPIGVASKTSGVTGRHGSVFDMWLASTSRNSGDRYPAAGSGLFAQFGSIIVPWNGGAVNFT